MRLLIVNWRDLDNPWAGGAEVHIHAIASGLVARGHEVTLLVSKYPGCDAESWRDGVRILRRGNRWTANFSLFAACRAELKRHSYDAVIEDVNKIPFFTPLVHGIPTIVYVPHLFGTTVFRETNPLFASYVYLMERPIPWVYRDAAYIAISESTAQDLVERGVPEERVRVVHCGLEFDRYQLPEAPTKNARTTLVHLGRLMRYKSADVALVALDLVRRTIPDARLEIIGDGPDLKRLKKLCSRMGLTKAVEFTGYLSHDAKVERLWKSHLLINPSPKEGWGLTVVEANACGLPVVASRAPGLQDSVRDGETGLLVPYGDAARFAEAALTLLQDDGRHAAFAARAREWARRFRWEDAVLQTEQILDAVVLQEEPGTFL